uniref:Brinker DNA-binding domain-containing protein n=1 Tax=Meloidogyne floridensis TaxID=298350 RepID=A0A915NHJ8_9BILA
MSQNEVVINVSEGEASENDEGPSNPKKIRRYFTITKKLEVVDFAKKNSVNAASRNFNVDRKCVKEWMEQEKQLREMWGKGAIKVAVLSTGHDKQRITVMLTARNDGYKCRPFVLLNRRRPDTKVVEKFKNRLFLSWAGFA